MAMHPNQTYTDEQAKEINRLRALCRQTKINLEAAKLKDTKQKIKGKDITYGEYTKTLAKRIIKLDEEIAQFIEEHPKVYIQPDTTAQKAKQRRQYKEKKAKELGLESSDDLKLKKYTVGTHERLKAKWNSQERMRRYQIENLLKMTKSEKNREILIRYLALGLR